MGFDVMSKIEGGIGDKMSQLSNSLPGGKVPMAKGMADLKGTIPNTNTMKKVFSPKAKIPTEFQKDFQEEDLISKVGASTPSPKQLEIPNDPPTEEPEIDEKKLREEGFTDKQIKEEVRKKKIRDKRKAAASKIKGKLKSGADALMKNAMPAIGAQIAGNLLGGGGCGPNLMAKIAAFKYFKDQMNVVNKRTSNVGGETGKLKETGKDILKGITESIAVSGKLKAEGAKLDGEAASAEAPTKVMKPTGVSHPGLGNKANSGATQKSREAIDKAKGFASNLGQTMNNVGKVIKGVIDVFKGLFGLIIKAIGAVLKVLDFLVFQKQALEIMMLVSLKNDACSNNGNPELNPATNSTSPEQFLDDIGYPGYSNEDSSPLLKDTINTMDEVNVLPNPFPNLANNPLQNGSSLGGNGSSLGGNGSSLGGNGSSLGGNGSSLGGNGSSLGGNGSSSNPHIPIMMGVTQIGIPLSTNDLDPSASGKTFDSHPILGDISDINPQLINELYEDGVLPLIDPNNPNELSTKKYEKDLDKLYDDTIAELQNNQQIEYIEKLYNLNFEMIVYRRYEA